MKLITPSFEIIEQEPRLQGVYKQIELAGRTCYKSQNLITPDSAEKFAQRMIKSGHLAMVEHGAVYLFYNDAILKEENIDQSMYERLLDVVHSPYSKSGYYVAPDGKWEQTGWYVSTNMRVIVEKDAMWTLNLMCDPTPIHEKRVTVRFICDIGVSREFNRHRVDSPAEQSTRYCNYTKDKFGNQLSIVRPEEIAEEDALKTYKYWSMLDENDSSEDIDDDFTFTNMCCNICNYGGEDFGIIDTWLFANLACQWSYFRLIQLGWKPEQARRVLPLDLQTELVHTAFVSDWEHFFLLRDANDAHPQARELAHPLHEEFIKRNYITK